MQATSEGPFSGTFEYRRYDVAANRLIGPAVVLNGPTQAMIGEGALWAASHRWLMRLNPYQEVERVLIAASALDRLPL